VEELMKAVNANNLFRAKGVTLDNAIKFYREKT
jgi:hypothetical protein